MAAERNTRREILKKAISLAPLAGLAAAFGVGGARTANAQTYNENVIVNSPYKIGIGVAEPTYPLDVQGGIRVTGTMDGTARRAYFSE